MHHSQRRQFLNLPGFMRPLLILLWVMTSLWTSFACAQPARSIEISDIEQMQVLPQHVQFYEEMPNQSIKDILNQPDLNWQALKTSGINLGKKENAIWFRFSVSNKDTQDVFRLLDMRWLNVAEVDYYQAKSDGSWEHFAAGLSVPKSELYRDATSYVFPIDLAADTSSDIYLRIKTSFIVYAPLFIFSEEKLEYEHFVYFLFLAATFGVLVSMLLYNALLYVFTHDKSYAWYSVYVLSIMSFILASSGIGYHLIWGDSLWWRMNSYGLTVTLSFLGAAMFIRNFLDLKQHGGWVLHVNTVMCIYWAAALLLTPTGVTFTRTIGDSIALLSNVLAIITSVYLWQKGDKTARNFLFAWGILIIFTTVRIMLIQGHMPSNFLTENGQFFGFIAEVLLLSFALADRINRERVTREKAQAKSLEMQRLLNREREAKLQAQDKLLELQTETNQQLEQRVAERTEALVRTLKDLKTANQELSRLSTTDSLTRLHNRRYFDEVLEKEFDRARQHRHHISLILIDIDHFKQFNDTHGHLVGDDCLRLVAASLQDVVTRNADLVARFGGEEFAVVLLETKEDDAMLVAERIRKHINGLKFINRGQKLPISASLGVAGILPFEGDTTEQLIAASDKALYVAKNEGRNRTIRASQPRSNQSA